MSVTVIICSFNNESTIIETLESVKIQKYKPLNLIISDDCSSDETNNLVHKWVIRNKKSFESVKHLISKKNKGTCRNFYYALNQTNSTYIKPLGADDLLKEGSLEKSIRLLTSNFSDVLVSTVNSIDNKGNKLRNYLNQGYFLLAILFKLPRSLLLYLCLYQNIFPHSTVIAKKNVFKECIDLNFDLVEDHPLWINIILSKFRIIFSSKSTIFYRSHNNQLTKTINKEILRRTEEDRKKFLKNYFFNISNQAEKYGILKYKFIDRFFQKVFSTLSYFDSHQNISIIFHSLRIFTFLYSPFWRYFIKKSISYETILKK